MDKSPVFVGMRVGLLTVAKRLPRAPDQRTRSSRWLCRCDCDGERETTGHALLQAKATCCGCQWYNPGRTTHGASKTPEFWVWWAMKQRCHTPTNPQWGRYGGRGITVCKRWRDSFAAFMLDMGPRPEGGTLGRKNNNRGYSPGNCRWETRRQQMNNTSANHWLRIEGERVSVAEAARRFGISEQCLHHRIRAGWPKERLSLPAMPRQGRVLMTKRKMVRFGRTTLSVAEWSQRTGIGQGALLQRLRAGWPVKRALTEPVKPSPQPP